MNAPPPEPTRYVLAWMEEIEPRLLIQVRRDIEDEVALPREQVEVDVWLESPGGDAHTAYKLALMLRHTACHVRVVVPDYAKSAATLLALVGDEIFMAPGAELGPLDAQMPEEGSLSGAISALNIARAADAVAEDAIALAGRGGAELLVQTGLSRADTLNAMLRFSAQFSEPLVRQLDPKLVHHAKELLRVTQRYAQRLLTKHLVAGRAQSIAERLVVNFPTHGFVISYEDADALGLPVRPIDAYDMLDTARGWHRAAEDGEPMVAFGELSSFLFDEDEDGEEDQNNEHERKPAVEAANEREGDAAGDAEAAAPDGHKGHAPISPESGAI